MYMYIYIICIYIYNMCIYIYIIYIYIYISNFSILRACVSFLPGLDSNKKSRRKDQLRQHECQNLSQEICHGRDHKK